MQSLITLTNAVVTRGDIHLAGPLNFTLSRGEHTALVGSNGSGKTTLLRLVRGDIMPDIGGERVYDFGDGPQHTVLGVRQRLALVSSDQQDFYSLNAMRTSGRSVVLSGFYDTPLLYQGATPDQEAAADELIDYLGIRQLTESSMGALSTGQMRKILIARALVCSPDVLLLDESLEGLDAASREEVLTVIDKAAERSTLVFAAHRVGDVPLSIGRTVIMDGGVIIAEGDRANALELLQDNAPEIAACEVPALPVAADFDFLLRMENVSVVSDGTQIMYDIDWTIRSGDQWIVLGGNGAGKSTLLQLIMSEISPYADDEKGVGTIERFDGMTMDMARSHIGVVSPAFQTAYGRELAWEPTALETVLSGYRGSVGMLDEPTAEELLGAQEWLGLVGLGDLSDRPLRRMSYGQQRRVLLARAMAPGPDLLLLDEPLGGLDPASRGLMVMLLQQLAEGGTPMVLVTHHGEDRIPAINMVMELEKGRQIFCGTREEYERATSEKEV